MADIRIRRVFVVNFQFWINYG